MMKDYLLNKYQFLTKEMIDQLVDNRIVMNVSDLQKLTFNALINLNGFNKQTANDFLSAIQQSDNDGVIHALD